MGPHHPETKRAWQLLNEKLGTCPKCGSDPFEGADAVKSYLRASYEVVRPFLVLAQANIITIPDLTLRTDSESSTSPDKEQTPGIVRINEKVINLNPDLANVEVLEEKMRCKSCDAVWKPNHWEISLSEFGFTVYKY